MSVGGFEILPLRAMKLFIVGLRIVTYAHGDQVFLNVSVLKFNEYKWLMDDVVAIMQLSIFCPGIKLH